jgi:hypothetical protein
MINQPASMSEGAAFRTQPRELCKKILYGLPCANCRSYYQSDLAICPICQCSDRISQKPPFTHLATAF